MGWLNECIYTAKIRVVLQFCWLENNIYYNYSILQGILHHLIQLKKLSKYENQNSATKNSATIYLYLGDACCDCMRNGIEKQWKSGHK